MARMNLTPLDDVLDKHFGKIGTPNAMHSKVMWMWLCMLID